MTFLGTIFVYALLFGSLLYWPVFMAIHRRWDFAARRLFVIFLINAFLDTAYLSLWVGPWRAQDTYTPLFGIAISDVVCVVVSILFSFGPKNRLSGALKWIGGGLVALIACLGIHTRFVLDWQNQPICHKYVMLMCQEWLEEHSTNAYPNVGGRMSNSMAEVDIQWGETDWRSAYNYVPGLSKDDPGDLVFCYLKQPTRWIWHGPPQSYFKPKAWIVVPVDFAMGFREVARHGEQSEILTTAEFGARLQKTLDFLRANNRPNWQTVVAEQTQFLDSIKEANLR